MSILEKFAYSHQHLRLHKWSNYLEVYEKYFSKFAGKTANVLLIDNDLGMAQMMVQYLDCRVVVVSTDPKRLQFDYQFNNIRVLIGDAYDVINHITAIFDRIDIVIDGGDHLNHKQIRSFQALYHLLAPGAVYLIEATHAAYWESYGGGYKKDGTIMAMAKDLIDHLHANHLQEPDKPAQIMDKIKHIDFYDSILVFEMKNQDPTPKIILTGSDDYRGPIVDIRSTQGSTETVGHVADNLSIQHQVTETKMESGSDTKDTSKLDHTGSQVEQSKLDHSKDTVGDTGSVKKQLEQPKLVSLSQPKASKLDTESGDESTSGDTGSEKKRRKLSKLLHLSRSKASHSDTESEGTPKRKSLANLFKKSN